MIGVVYGTTGELIKLAPVLRRLQDRGAPVLGLCTGQQVQQIPAMLQDFSLPQPDVWLGRGQRGRDLEHAREIPPWAGQVAASFRRWRRAVGRRLRSDGRPPLLLVHGDTFTTIGGALMGRALDVPVAHVEAGMRSGRITAPFPEELNRRATARVAALHFAPGARAVGNLRAERVRGEVVDTGQNTVRDNLELIPPGIPPGLSVPEEPFGLVSLHRFELLENRAALRAVLEVLAESASRRPLLFVDHPTTASAVSRAGLDRLFGERFRRIPRQRYFPFLALVKASAFVVTDSGGSQEECAFLGQPCLVHRAVTEHDTGLDGSVVLSRLDLGVVREFLLAPEAHRVPAPPPTARPSDRVVQHLEARGHLGVVGR